MAAAQINIIKDNYFINIITI